MQLEEFVAESLSQVMRGVKAAMDAAKETGAQINPKLLPRDSKGGGGPLTGFGGEPLMVERVEFDVAVTVREGTESKAGIGVVSGIFGAGAKGSSAAESGSVTRIKFTVPLVWPTQR